MILVVKEDGINKIVIKNNAQTSGLVELVIYPRMQTDGMICRCGMIIRIGVYTEIYCDDEKSAEKVLEMINETLDV